MKTFLLLAALGIIAVLYVRNQNDSRARAEAQAAEISARAASAAAATPAATPGRPAATPGRKTTYVPGANRYVERTVSPMQSSGGGGGGGSARRATPASSSSEIKDQWGWDKKQGSTLDRKAYR